MKKRNIARVNIAANRNYTLGNNKRFRVYKNTNNSSQDSPNWLKIALEVAGGIALIVKAISPFISKRIEANGKINREKAKGQEDRDTEDKRHLDKLEEQTHEIDEKIRLLEAKDEIRRRYSNNNVRSVSEDPSTWSRPCHKYIAIHNSRGKEISETRYDEFPIIDGQQIFGDLIKTSDIALICGGSGVGKTQLAANICYCVADGKPIEAIPHRGKLIKMPAVYVSSERMTDEINKRFRGYRPEDFHYFDSTKFETVEDCLDFICEKKQEFFKSDGLFVFDQVSSLFGEKMNDARVEFFIKILGIIQEDYRQIGTLTFLLLLHPNKDGEDKERVSSSQMSGSVYWLRLVNTTMILTASTETANLRFLQLKKTRGIEDQRNLTYVMELQENPVLHFKYVKTLGRNGRGKGGKVYRTERERIEKLHLKGYTITEIAKKMHRDPKTIRKKIHSLSAK